MFGEYELWSPCLSPVCGKALASDVGPGLIFKVPSITIVAPAASVNQDQTAQCAI